MIHPCLLVNLDLYFPAAVLQDDLVWANKIKMYIHLGHFLVDCACGKMFDLHLSINHYHHHNNNNNNMRRLLRLNLLLLLLLLLRQHRHRKIVVIHSGIHCRLCQRHCHAWVQLGVTVPGQSNEKRLLPRYPTGRNSDVCKLWISKNYTLAHEHSVITCRPPFCMVFMLLCIDRILRLHCHVY
jgi:hypothetical protein